MAWRAARMRSMARPARKEGGSVAGIVFDGKAGDTRGEAERHIFGHAFGFVRVARLEVRIYRQRCCGCHFANVPEHFLEWEGGVASGIPREKATPAEVVASASNPR